MNRLCLLVICVVVCASSLLARIKVACVGDSITYGYKLPHRESEAYPVQLQQLLGEAYEVRNFGNSGRGIYLHSKRGKEMRGYRYMDEHKAALAWQPDIVICNLGINDCGEFEPYERAHPGAFARDYQLLLSDYQALPTQPKLWIWTKLAPLAPGQKFYRSAEPFLMQHELETVAAATQARTLDLQAPLLPLMIDHFPDLLHPDAVGARVIAEVTAKALLAPAPVITTVLPADLPATTERWLCAGQSNMEYPLHAAAGAKEEAAATATYDLRIWTPEQRSWVRVTPENAGQYSALAIAFANRRAAQTHAPQALYIVAAGGAPTEAFLSNAVMARYPTLLPELTNRLPLDQNQDFLPRWCAQEYAKRLTRESKYWAIGALYEGGLREVLTQPLTGILWYQGESNATTNLKPDTPLPTPYLEETLRAIITQLRADPKTPFLMMGLPKMDRPWGPYRAAQQRICSELQATYIPTEDLGEEHNVHPRDKRPFAERAVKALK